MTKCGLWSQKLSLDPKSTDLFDRVSVSVSETLTIRCLFTGLLGVK